MAGVIVGELIEGRVAMLMEASSVVARNGFRHDFLRRGRDQ